MVRHYEIMFLVDANWFNRSSEDAEAAIGTLIERRGGKIRKGEKWDERKLAYPIRIEQTVHKRGVYWLAAVELPPDEIATLRHEIQLSPNVIRALIQLRREGELDRIFEEFPDVMARKNIADGDDDAPVPPQFARSDGNRG